MRVSKFDKLSVTSQLSIVSIIVLVAGIFVAVIGSQQSHEERSRASTGTVCSSTSNKACSYTSDCSAYSNGTLCEFQVNGCGGSSSGQNVYSCQSGKWVYQYWTQNGSCKAQFCGGPTPTPVKAGQCGYLAVSYCRSATSGCLSNESQNPASQACSSGSICCAPVGSCGTYSGPGGAMGACLTTTQCSAKSGYTNSGLTAGCINNTICCAPVPTSTPTPVPLLQTVKQFDLKNANNNTYLLTITNGSTVNLASFGTSCLNIRALTNPEPVGSVVFGYDGNSSYHTENTSPYYIGGDNSGSPYCWTLTTGSHTLTATPYTGANGSGSKGSSKTVSFTVTNESPTNTPYPTNTPTPRPTNTPVPTPMPTSTPELLPTYTPYPTYTPIPQPSNTPAPTSTPYPTSTPVPGDTQLALTVFLHGIGLAGDSANPGSQGNMNPNHPQRTVSVDVYDSQNNQVMNTVTGTVNFNATAGDFTGTIDVGSTLKSGFYTLKVKSDQYLRATMPGIQSVTAGAVNTLPAVTLIAGDINNDNAINILDYNLLMGCYSDLLPPVSCDPSVQPMADLTDDGAVNQFDYNLFIRELTNIGGE